MQLLKRSERNTFFESVYIIFVMFLCGIIVNPVTGRLYYLPFHPICRCKSLKLVRHGKTIAVEKKEFMSNNSPNSKLSSEGIVELHHVANNISSLNPDVVLIGPLPRTLKTYEIISDNLKVQPKHFVCQHLVGINNSVWEEKTFDMLDTDNLCVFLERECSHNIFAKTHLGDSWGDVLVRSAKLLHEINKLYPNQKVLLVSQGSVYQCLMILLHLRNHPWDGYTASSMFGTLNNKSRLIGYGRVFNIC